MHFSKTYTELLLSLPPELRNNAIEYRKLKKLINQVVQELTQLGLSPDVLQQVHLESRTSDPSGKGKGKATDISSPNSDLNSSPSTSPPPTKLTPWLSISSSADPSSISGLPRVIYEINTESDKFEPRLRLLVSASEVGGGHDRSAKLSLPILETLERYGGESPTPPTPHEEEGDLEVGVGEKEGGKDGNKATNERLETPEAVIDPPMPSRPTSPSARASNDEQEVIIPLPSDTVFFQVLMQALQTLSTQLGVVADEFIENLRELSKAISDTARPMSATSTSFSAHSHGTHPATVKVGGMSSIVPFLGGHGKSDLYQWREIFQMYMDMDVFEDRAERTRGERSVEDAEERLEKFRAHLQERGYTAGRALQMKESMEALEKFVKLNVFILDLKKFQFATTEATRKILKKHAKRTALPVSPGLSSLFTISTIQSPASSDPATALIHSTSRPGTSLSLLLIQAIGESLLPIIPHIDDYSCVICTSIAFKPIRLRCGHLFCVRCLVKMQKRGKGNCPMCRAETVLQADRSNVDWALLNFMKDWFPIEAREKLHQNEKEATEEQMQELGFKLDGPACVLM